MQSINLIELLRGIGENPICNLITWIITIILALFIFFISKNKKILYYDIWGSNIVSKINNKDIKDIDILYKNKKIDSITITNIVIWNSGNETIRKSDIPSDNKFKIEILGNNMIYNCEVINNKNDFIKLIMTENMVCIDFEYLEPNQGFIIKVFHTGNDSGCLRLKGAIIGGSFRLVSSSGSFSFKLNNNLGRNPTSSSWYIYSHIFKFIATIIGFVSIIISIFVPDLSFVIKLYFLIIGIFLMYIGLKSFFVKRLPKDLNNILKNHK